MTQLKMDQQNSAKLKLHIVELYDQQVAVVQDTNQYLLSEDVKQSMTETWETALFRRRRVEAVYSMSFA